MYNFNEFVRIMEDIKIKKANSSNLKDLRNELNKFFKDSKCREVIYTENSDKMFFGMSVMPVLNSNYLEKLVSSEAVRFDSYYLELDSKLFSPLMNLTPRELTAILLHEVGHIVNNVVVSKQLSEVVNVMIAEEGIEIDYKEAARRHNFLELGFQRAIRKVYSFFHKNQEEYIADNFVVDCGFGKELESAYYKIVKDKELVRGPKASKHKLTTLVWSLNLYTGLNNRRRNVINQLKDAESLEGSELMRRAYSKAWENVKNSNDLFSESTVLTEGKFLDSLKYSTMNEFENELYEYKVRLQNLDDETEAMDILRELNFRISLIDEYIVKKAAENEVKKYTDLSNKYRFLREELVKDAKYMKKSYGLYIQYPEIKSRYATRI